MSGYDKRRAKPAQLRLEDIRALNASLSELAEASALHRLHIMDHVQQIEKIKGEQGYPAG